MATEILSFGKFKSEYNTEVTTSFADANAAIMGGSEPTEHSTLWTWYRNIDAATKAEAKAWMNAKVPQGVDSSVVRLTDFTNKYNTLVGTVTGTNAPDKVAIMRDVLAATKPTTSGNVDTWKAYQLLDASDKAAVKENIVFKPFVDGFTSVWDTAYGNANVDSFAKAAQLAGGTMTTGAAPAKVEGGKDTQPFWKAMTLADEREALQKVMFRGSKAVGTKLT